MASKLNTHMPENTHNKQSPCSVWIWGLLILGLILLFLLYSRATSEKAQEIQQDIQTRTSQNLLGSEHASAVIATTDGRDVTLKGVVDNQQAMITAEKIARQTAGVRQVNNQISVSMQEASVEAMPEEFAPLEDEVIQTDQETAIEQAQEKFSQLDFSNITFEKNSTALTPIAQQTLDSAAQALLENPSVNISVEGHTDSSGNPELNLKISKQRAESVFNYLVDAGIEATRIEANGFGDQFPIAPNETEAGRIKNRRIEIKVKNGE